ncbi:sigma-70 family RNA polymerase sigma factor, partial [Alistipes shahii]|uniref:sigma-70 family RNA polymerase sigma factor n=3 Tax=Alistipes shahii TaxID=328814 RepID=UPI003AAA9FCB
MEVPRRAAEDRKHRRLPLRRRAQRGEPVSEGVPYAPPLPLVRGDSHLADRPKSPPHSEDAPDSRLIEAEVEELVRRLINDLPERCRTVFLLNRQEGLSSREIAEALSLSESTVRVQIKIAVDRIVAGIRTHYPDLKLVSLLLFLFTARF